MMEDLAHVDNQSNNDSDSDAPVAVSLKTAKTKRLTEAKEIQKQISLTKKKKKDAVREIRARRHERNILQKKAKDSQKKKIEAMLLDSSVLKNAKVLKMKLEKPNEDEMDVQSEKEGDESYALDDSGVTGSDSDAETDTETNAVSSILHKDPGVHVVSLSESSDYFLKKALEWKHQMLYGPHIPRMTYAEYKQMREKKAAADKRPKLQMPYHT